MIFQELIKFDFGTFFLDDDFYNTLQDLRHIKILLPKTEKIIHENSHQSPLYSKLYQFVLHYLYL